jgi:hypothetical protein
MNLHVSLYCANLSVSHFIPLLVAVKIDRLRDMNTVPLSNLGVELT